MKNTKIFVYKETLKETLNNVEIVMNHLNKLENNDFLSQEVIEKEMIKTILNLELALASYCILLRKMKENNMIDFDDQLRIDINSIIHSNRFEYEDYHIIVYSRKGREEVNLQELMNLGHSIVDYD